MADEPTPEDPAADPGDAGTPQGGGGPPWARRPEQPPAGFAGPRPPLPPAGPADVPRVSSQPHVLPPMAERASTRAQARRSRNRLVLGLLGALALIGAAAALAQVVRRDAKVEPPTQQADPRLDTTVPPQDPELHQVVRDWCSAPNPELARQLPPFEPGEVAATTVSYEQAIGAPGPRNDWFFLDVSPEVGTPEDIAQFEQTPVDRMSLATCLTRRGSEPTDITCSYTGSELTGAEEELVTLAVTPYEIRVIEVRTGKEIASGEVRTDGTTCPQDALVEMGDDVSGPMTSGIITSWFREHFVDGRPR